MNTHDVLLIIQYITISVLFIEIWIVFSGWKNSIHSYLLFTCISSFISNLGYLLEMKAASEEAYLTALKLSYSGRVWIAFAFWMFAAKMCGIRIPKWLKRVLGLVLVGIYITVLNMERSGLFYKEYRFIPDPVFPKFYHTNGNVHDFLMGINAVLIVFAMVWVILAYRREKNRNAKLRLLMLIIAFGIQASSFILHITHIFSISESYDLSMPGALFGNIFTLIGIFGFDLLGTKEIAKDFVIDRISEGIIAVDNEGRIQYFNEPVTKLYPEFDAFFSVNMGKLRGDTVSTETVEPADRGNEKKLIRTPYDIISSIIATVEKGETLRINDRIYTPEENDLVYKGESYGKLYALVDDTEHYQYMEELQKQRNIADSANEAKSRFLASMSHEIRTPINAVLGMDEMILRESTETPIRTYAANIMSAGKTLLSLINDILDLSKVEEGKMEIIPVQYDLSSLINDLVNMTRDRAIKKGLKFNINVDRHIPRLLTGDEIRIRQCVMNLLTNAVKYTETGEVTLTISFTTGENTTSGHILLDFKVEDTGIGMKAEDMEKLFSPYKRIEEKRNRAIEGTGLGMSITRQLLELMGSALKVKSEYGKGSEFSFAIDQEVVKWEEIGDVAARFGELSDRGYEYHELFHAPEARILVVDDTEMNLTVMQSLLKKTRIKIDTALSGREALHLASENLYDAIFIDHMMPDMDGIETLKHIRTSGTSKDAPAVALTANAVSGAREMYLGAGFTDYLSKPVDGEKLERMLCGMLPKEKVERVTSGMMSGETAESASADRALGKKPESMSSDRMSGEEREKVSSDLAQGNRFEDENIGSNSGTVAFPARFTEQDEIDVQAGLKNCGSQEGYISVLSVFHQTARDKADEIEKLWESRDIANYTVKVHALKSSARIIGASRLFEFAKSLEEAGKSGDEEYISQNTGRLLEMYRSLDKELSWLDKTDDELPAIEAEALEEAYRTIVEIAGSMDYEMMDDIIKELHGYSLPEADRKKLAEIEKMLTELDWDGIAKVAGH